MFWTLSLQALGPYSVSKTALLGLTRVLAPELAHSNIRVNCVAPGVIKTRFSSAVRRKNTVMLSLLMYYWWSLFNTPLFVSQLWQNEDIMDEFKKQLCIKRYSSHSHGSLYDAYMNIIFHFPLFVPPELGSQRKSVELLPSCALTRRPTSQERPSQRLEGWAVDSEAPVATKQICT